MKKYPRNTNADWNAVRKVAHGIHTTADEVIVYEAADEVPPPNIQPPPEPDPVLDADGHVFRRRLLRLLAQKFGMTVSELKGALGRDA